MILGLRLFKSSVMGYGTAKERHDTDAAAVLIPKIAINTRTGGEKILVIADSR